MTEWLLRLLKCPPTNNGAHRLPLSFLFYLNHTPCFRAFFVTLKSRGTKTGNEVCIVYLFIFSLSFGLDHNHSLKALAVVQKDDANFTLMQKPFSHVFQSCSVVYPHHAGTIPNFSGISHLAKHSYRKWNSSTSHSVYKWISTQIQGQIMENKQFMYTFQLIHKFILSWEFSWQVGEKGKYANTKQSRVGIQTWQWVRAIYHSVKLQDSL